jgi:hypothetical protein
MAWIFAGTVFWVIAVVLIGLLAKYSRCNSEEIKRRVRFYLLGLVVAILLGGVCLTLPIWRYL